MKPILVIYHAECTDGFAAAYIVHEHYRKRLGLSVELLAASYGDEPPRVDGRQVFVVDLSWPRADMIRMNDQADHLVVIDHHKSAEKELERLGFCAFDMNRSGAMLAWDYFNSHSPAPLWVKYVQDRDLWTKKLVGSDLFAAYARTVPHEIEAWRDAVDTMPVEKCIEYGGRIVAYQQTIIQNAVKRAALACFGGTVMPCANSRSEQSEIAHRLCLEHKGRSWPAAFVWFEDEGFAVVSLRSHNGGEDVSEIAGKYGGGGHEHAAGCRIPMRQFVNTILLPETT